MAKRPEIVHLPVKTTSVLVWRKIVQPNWVPPHIGRYFTVPARTEPDKLGVVTMQYSKKQIRYILKTSGHNIKNAIIKDGRVFVNDITLAPGLHQDSVEFTYRGAPVNLALDDINRRRAISLLQRAYNIDARRRGIRRLFQKISDKLTANYKLEQMSDLEIRAWFALDKIEHNTRSITIDRVGYMYNIRCGDVVLSHIPADEKDRKFLMLFNNQDILDISHKTANQHLFNRASAVFFGIYADTIAPAIKAEQKKHQNTR